MLSLCRTIHIDLEENLLRLIGKKTFCIESHSLSQYSIKNQYGSFTKGVNMLTRVWVDTKDHFSRVQARGGSNLKTS